MNSISHAWLIDLLVRYYKMNTLIYRENNGRAVRERNVYIPLCIYIFFLIGIFRNNGVIVNVRRNVTSRSTKLENYIDCPNDTRHGSIDKFHFVYINNWLCSDSLFRVHLLETLEIIPVFRQYIFLSRLAHMCRSLMHTQNNYLRFLPRLSGSVRNICLGVCSRGVCGKIHKLFIKNNRDTAAARVRLSKRS